MLLIIISNHHKSGFPVVHPNTENAACAIGYHGNIREERQLIHDLPLHLVSFSQRRSYTTHVTSHNW